MIDELEIKQRKMLLEAEFSYMWSDTYTKTQKSFGADRCSYFNQIKDKLKYYKSLEMILIERKTMLTTMESLQYYKNKKDQEINSGKMLSNIEQLEYKKACKDIEILKTKINKLEINMK